MHPCLKKLRHGDIVHSYGLAHRDKRKEISWNISVSYDSGERVVFFNSPPHCFWLSEDSSLIEDSFLDNDLIKIVKSPK